MFLFLFVPICYFICQCQDHAYFYMPLPFNTLIFFIVVVFCLFSFFCSFFYDSPSHNKLHQLQAAGFDIVIESFEITQCYAVACTAIFKQILQLKKSHEELFQKHKKRGKKIQNIIENI